MTPTDTELADARECLARLAEFAGGDDYLSAGSVRQNVEAVQTVLARPDAAEGRTVRVGDVVRIVRVVRSGNVTPPNLVGRTGTVVHVGVATANVDLAGPDGGVQVLAQDELRHADATAGRDLTAQDVEDALAVLDIAEGAQIGYGFRAAALHLNGIARPALATTSDTNGPSVVVDRTMRRLSAPDLPAVGQHAGLARSLRAGPADAGNASTIAVLRDLAAEIEAFRQQPIEDGEDPTRAAGAAAVLDMVNARIRTAERSGDHQVATNEPAS